MIKLNMSKLIKNRSAKILTYAILFRLLTNILYFIILIIFSTENASITMTSYLNAWDRWDARHYINIANLTYFNYIEDGKHLFLVFLPLYPWIIRILNLFIHNTYISALIISTICYGVGCVYFDKFLVKQFSSEISKWTLISISLYPFAFFYSAIMTESLFFMIAAIFLHELSNDRYYNVAFWGCLACMSKLQGAFLSFVVLIYLCSKGRFIYLIRKREYKSIISKIIIPGLKCVPMLFGLIIYFLINYLVEGNPFRFMYYQSSHWGHTVGPFWKTVIYMKDYFVGNYNKSEGWVLWLPELVMFFICVLAIIYSIRKKLPSYLITYIVVFGLVTYSSTWLISGGRYCLSILPLFIIEGMIIKDHINIRRVTLLLSYSLYVIYMIGYFKWMSIM